MKMLRLTVVLPDDSDEHVKMALLSLQSKVDTLLRDVPATKMLLEDYYHVRNAR